MATKEEVFSKVQWPLVDALGVDEEEVTPEATAGGRLGRRVRSTFWISCSAWKKPSTSRFRAANCFPKTF